MSEFETAGTFSPITIHGHRTIILVPHGQEAATVKGDILVVELRSSVSASETEALAAKLDELVEKVEIKDMSSA